jgi:predicted alpha/beta hydrolase
MIEQVPAPDAQQVAIASGQLLAGDAKAIGITRFSVPAEVVCSAQGLQVVMAGATGVPQRFYRKFATYLAARGTPVTTFDYRGIGASAPRSLRGFEASVVDWAKQDLECVLQDALSRGPTIVVAHSVGGHVFGLAPSAPLTLGLYTFGSGAGWAGHMATKDALQAQLMWRVLAPPLVALLGYLPSRQLGLGEDLPRGVYAQWRRWCQYPRYFFDDASMNVASDFDRIRLPVAGATASDDLWATPASQQAFMSGYRHAQLELRTLAPRAGGIGHMGYFRPAQSWLWDETVAWLHAQYTQAHAA